MQDIKDVAFARYEICKTCPRKTDLLKVEKCKECNCVLFLKVIVPTSKCPIGKW